MPSPDRPDLPVSLDDLPTGRTAAFVVERYAPAMRAYVCALVSAADEADEVVQDVAVRLLERGFGRFDPTRGRLREYLKAALRNAVASRKRRRPPPAVGADGLDAVPAADGHPADAAWDDGWRAGLLDRAWAGLADHERRSPGNAYHTALRLLADHPGEDSVRLAERATAALGRPVRPAAFRQQVSRGRRLFARLLVDEVAATLDPPTREAVLDELAALRLLAHVHEFLPPA